MQASCIAYVCFQIPLGLIWGATIDKIILLMGFGEPVAALAKDYVWVHVGIAIMDGLTEAVLDFLEVIEHEKYANILDSLASLIEVGAVALVVIFSDANLVICGLVMLMNGGLFFFLHILIPHELGWLRHFERGLYGQCSLRNRAMLKELFKQALPLAFGSLLAYAEWEVLTVFAAVLGPAEAATWGEYRWQHLFVSVFPLSL